MAYTVWKFLHIVGATVLLGTGAGIAFFMLRAHLTKCASHIAKTASTVVFADMIFTATAVVCQPLTGWMLADEVGLPLTTGWIAVSLGLYVLTGLCWLPVVGIQIRLRNLAAEAASMNTLLGEDYRSLFRIWFALGVPAFVSVMTIIWLMIAKPKF